MPVQLTVNVEPGSLELATFHQAEPQPPIDPCEPACVVPICRQEPPPDDGVLIPNVLAVKLNTFSDTIMMSPGRTPDGTVNVNAVEPAILVAEPFIPVL